MAAISAQFWSKARAAQVEPGRGRTISSIVTLGTALKRAESRAKQNKPKLGPSPVKRLRRSKTAPTAVAGEWLPTTPASPGAGGMAGGMAGGVFKASVALRSIAAAKKAAYRAKTAELPPVQSRSPRDDFSRKTVWVGAIPDHAANEIFLENLFSTYGDVETVAVRYKPSARSSWAVISFADEISASICLDEEQVSIGGAKLIIRRTKLDNSPAPALGDPDKVWDTAVKYQAVLDAVQRNASAVQTQSMLTALTEVARGGETAHEGGSASDEDECGGCYVGQILRHTLRRLIISRGCDWVTLVAVLANCVSLILWDPQDEQSDMQVALRTADDVFVWIFTAEALLKIAAFGVWEPEHAYFKNAWNGLDFFICVTSLLDLFIREHADLALLRAARSLKPLRIVTRMPSLQVLLYSVLTSIPRLKVIFIVLILMFLIFGLFSVQLWMGLFYNRCFAPGDLTPSENNPSSSFYYAPRLTLCTVDGPGRRCPLGTECKPYDWNPHFDVISYNSLVGGFIIVFQTMTLDNWSDLMYMTMDVSGFPAALYL